MGFLQEAPTFIRSSPRILILGRWASRRHPIFFSPFISTTATVTSSASSTAFFTILELKFFCLSIKKRKYIYLSLLYKLYLQGTASHCHSFSFGNSNILCILLIFRRFSC